MTRELDDINLPTW